MESSTYTMPDSSGSTVILSSHLRGVNISKALANTVKIYDGTALQTLIFSAAASTAPNYFNFHNAKMTNGKITVVLGGADSGFVTVITD